MLQDLVILAADNQMQQTLEGLLERHAALGIRRITSRVFVHPNKDAGCRLECAAFLRSFLQQYQRAIVVFDHEGSGADGESATALEESIEHALFRNGWGDRCRVITIEPELEIWIWGRSGQTPAILGWTGSDTDLKDWLIKLGFAFDELGKPVRPKEALLAVLKKSKTKHEASLYRKLATKVGFQHCKDRAFTRLRGALTDWFGNEPKG
ncbi:MAG: hypothetical protein U1A77_12555 [Pirellulales bacterium]